MPTRRMQIYERQKYSPLSSLYISVKLLIMENSVGCLDVFGFSFFLHVYIVDVKYVVEDQQFIII